MATFYYGEFMKIIVDKEGKTKISGLCDLALKTAGRIEDDQDERQLIEQALRSLPAEQREVIHLKVYEDMTFQQIAQTLGLSINTAASRYRYALEKLRRLLESHFTKQG